MLTYRQFINETRNRVVTDWISRFDHHRETGTIKAAVRARSGKVYTGYDHEGAFSNLMRGERENYKFNEKDKLSGFVMPNGKFMTRKEVEDEM